MTNNLRTQIKESIVDGVSYEIIERLIYDIDSNANTHVEYHYDIKDINKKEGEYNKPAAYIVKGPPLEDYNILIRNYKAVN